MSISRCISSAALLLCTLMPVSVVQAAPTVNLPPGAHLDYSIKAKLSGVTVSGRARVLWQVAGGKYLTATETSAILFGKILDERSEGSITPQGLVPLAYTEKRFRKEPTTTRFDRHARLMRFGENGQTQPLKGGEQDRASAIWQMIALVRAEKRPIVPGMTWRFMVAGQRDADPWTFIVRKRERINTALGEMEAVHIVRNPPADAKQRQVDIWLAPSLEWYPVRIRFQDSGEFVEQFIEEIKRS